MHCDDIDDCDVRPDCGNSDDRNDDDVDDVDVVCNDDGVGDVGDVIDDDAVGDDCNVGDAGSGVSNVTT